jgi:hypothetical protein
MATFTEQKVLKQVTVLTEQSAANVQWANQVLKDGEVISEQFERKAYTSEQKADFLAEVEGAESYVAVLGW